MAACGSQQLHKHVSSRRRTATHDQATASLAPATCSTDHRRLLLRPPALSPALASPSGGGREMLRRWRRGRHRPAMKGRRRHRGAPRPRQLQLRRSASTDTPAAARQPRQSPMTDKPRHYQSGNDAASLLRSRLPLRASTVYEWNASTIAHCAY